MSEGTTRLGVVFIHGLFSSEATWDPFAQLLESDEELAASIMVRRFGYASPKFRSLRPDRRTPDYNDLAERLKAFLFYEASEHDRLVLVAHSQGGLIVQRYLARMISEGRGQELAKIRSVLLFACPNDGSDFLLSLRSVWLSKHPQVRALKPLDPGVKDAQRTVLNKIVQAAPGTAEPSSCHIPFWVFGGLQDNIVVRASAEGVFPNVSMLPGDHSTVIQPASHQAPAYLALRKHLRDAQQHEEPVAPTTMAPVPAPAEPPPAPWGDSAKAARILDVLPPYADWLKTLRTQDFFVVSGRINRLFHEAADAFKIDRLEFIDAELRGAATACRSTVMELSEAMIDLLFADRIDTQAAEKLPVEEQEDAWTFVLREHQRGKDELRLHTLRDAFFEAYDTLLRLLNERLFVPEQTVTTTSSSTPATVADPRAVPDAADQQLRVGQGLARHERELSAAYGQLRTAGLGAPTSEAYLSGATAVQHFAAAAGSGPGWVLSLRKGRAVAVSEPLWAALEDAGRPSGDGDPLAAVGYPTTAGTDPKVLDPDVPRVALDGGNWGPGLLVFTDHGWRWEPQVALDFNQTRSATNWTATQPAPQLRIRAVVTLPWDTAPDSVTTTHRRDLTGQLPFSPLAGAVTTLSLRRAADLPAAHWILGPHRNALDSLSYSADIAAPDGQPALTAAVMASLPGAKQPTVTCAEFLIQNSAAWAALLPTGTSTNLALEEVESLLLAAWETAADLLPAATCDVATMRWASAPTVELRLSTEGPHDQPRAHLGALIDLSELGPTDRSSLPEMAVTITVSPMLERTERQQLLQRALVYMLQGFGFVEADDRLFT
ncbi:MULTISPECIES: alpha/beta fold hydrolase [Streptomyces]|uniref:Alpha/beta fold hydrolase n=2 Tax=Streptomyces TaxID=1883 RepID=A0ABV9J9P5_9ACTN